MRSCHWLIVLCMVLAGGLPARGANPEIEKHIRGLSSDDWRERQAAEEALVTFGEQAEGPLRELIATTADVEARSRAEGALEQIAENRVSGPSLITMDFDGAAPAEVFAELARQAHAPLPTMPEDLWTQRQWPGVTIKADREPFWSVMQKLCRQLGLGLQVPGTREGLTIVTGGGIEFTKSPTVISGPFLIVAQQVTENRTVRFSDPANTSQQMNLQLLVIAEPKLELSGRSSSLNVLAAENEDGQSLVQLSPHSSSVMMDNRHSWGLMAQLARIPDSEKLAVFKGETTAQIAVKKETLEIDDILAAKNVSRPLAGREVVIESAEMSGDQLVVHVIVRGDLHGMAIHNLFRQFRVQDAAGNDWGQSGFRSNGRNGETRGEIRFVSRGGMPPQRRMGGEPAGPPARLVWEAVTETKDITLEFEFRNLPLP